MFRQNRNSYNLAVKNKIHRTVHKVFNVVLAICKKWVAYKNTPLKVQYNVD